MYWIPWQAKVFITDKLRASCNKDNLLLSASSIDKPNTNKAYDQMQPKYNRRITQKKMAVTNLATAIE